MPTEVEEFVCEKFFQLFVCEESVCFFVCLFVCLFVCWKCVFINYRYVFSIR